MAQGLNIPLAIWDSILQWLDDDTWRDQHLSSVSSVWQFIMVNGSRQRRRQGGTIVLSSPTDNFSQMYRTRGLTMGTLQQLAEHHVRWRNRPNHYDHVQIITNIRDYPRIVNPCHHLQLENIQQAHHIVAGGPSSYTHVTALDCHDNLQDRVTENWDSREMQLLDLFYPGVHYNGVSVPHTFVAILLARFFTHVTTLNLSATIWSNNAVQSIRWSMLQKLIWNRGQCFDLLLPHLATAANLEELRIDYSILQVDYRTVPNLWYLLTPNIEFTIFHNLRYCTQLTIFSCAHCTIEWSTQEAWLDDMYLRHIGQFCTQWLLHNAPLSLQEYTGPLHSNYRLSMAVLQRYTTDDNLMNPSINLTARPLDHREWITLDEDDVYV